ncbi:hypothetical protein GCM10010420_25740 [Streptomyces glaucosporus]|uniref:Acyl-CoA carboxylase subunit epsilon n=1 Tax=Streptomyces glaucosporus TaxID=284044 RepID=A0ABP5VDE6_9ACTN
MSSLATDVVRVERGQASEEELAAVTALLLARAAARTRSAEPRRPRRASAPWRRPERLPVYHAPHSWQH